MCILFIYNGNEEIESDYSLILVSNRDEFYHRPAQCMAPWEEDPNVYGGRDLEPGCEGGTWLAVSSSYKKLGLLLNLPGVKKENTKSRGKIVADFVKSEFTMSDYLKSIRDYTKNCNEFIFVAVEFGLSTPEIKTYNNATDEIVTWTDKYLGFGNSLPFQPLKKVEAGKHILKDICTRINKISYKTQLVEELVQFLKNEDRHFPDPQLENRQPSYFKELSSIFVNIPKWNYGTRSHTIILVTKSGDVNLIEITMKSPINIETPIWERNEFQFNL